MIVEWLLTLRGMTFIELSIYILFWSVITSALWFGAGNLYHYIREKLNEDH